MCITLCIWAAARYIKFFSRKTAQLSDRGGACLRIQVIIIWSRSACKNASKKTKIRQRRPTKSATLKRERFNTGKLMTLVKTVQELHSSRAPSIFFLLLQARVVRVCLTARVRLTLDTQLFVCCSAMIGPVSIVLVSNCRKKRESMPKKFLRNRLFLPSNKILWS